jgi:hypothetical protein
MWHKTDIKLTDEPFLRTIRLNTVVDNPHSVPQVVSAVTGNELTQLFAYQSSLYYSQNAHQWKSPPKTLMLSNITTSQTKNFLDNFDRAG